MGQAVVESQAFKSLKSHGKGNYSSEVDVAPDALKATFQTSAGWAPLSIRIPGMVVPFAVQEPMVVDVVPSAATMQAAVVYMEETTRTQAAAERAEGGEYVESAFALTQRSQAVVSVGHRVPVTDEQLEDVVAVRSYLDSRLVAGLRERLSSQMLNGAGTGVLLRGLWTAATGTEQEASSNDSVHETIYRAMVKVQTTAFRNANMVIIHPNDWREIRLSKTNEGIYLFGNPDVRGSTTVWGIPRTVTTEITENSVLVGDMMECAFYTRRGIMVETGYVADDFSHGRITIRAGVRGAMVTYRPAAFIKVTLQS